MQGTPTVRITTLVVVLVLAALLGPPAAAATTFVATLVASDAGADDQLGRAAAMSGNTVVLGAHRDDNHRGERAGAAYVFEVDRTGATREQKLVPSHLRAGDHFGWAVDIDGDTIVVGAHTSWPGSVNQAGSVDVFQRAPDGVWTHTATLTAADPLPGGNFGHDVAVSGDTIVVGADADALGRETPSVVEVFERQSDSAWARTDVLLGSDTVPFDRFGTAVDVAGTRLVVGARGDDGRAGSAYVFDRSGAGWTQTVKLLADSVTDEEWGISVALAGQRVVVGSTAEAVVLAEVTADGTVLGQTPLRPQDPGGSDRFGAAVDVGPDAVLVGAPGWDDVGAFNTGAGYLFVPDDRGGWSEHARLLADDRAAGDAAGEAVALSGDHAVLGAPLVDVPSASGAAHLFALRLNRAPVADAGPDQQVEATGPWTSVQLDGSASVDPDGSPLAHRWTGPFAEGGGTTNGVSPQVSLPPGTSTLRLTVEDPHGATDSDEATVLVTDTTPPTMSVPDDIVVPAESVSGAPVAFAVPTAEDLVDGPVTPVCDRTSGETFAIGEAVVTCVAVDGAANQSEVWFTVTVVPPEPPMIELDLIHDGHVNARHGTFRILATCVDADGRDLRLDVQLNDVEVAHDDRVKLHLNPTEWTHRPDTHGRRTLHMSAPAFTLGGTCTDARGMTAELSLRWDQF